MRRSRWCGFTLVEVMVSAVILVIVITTIFVMLTGGRASWQTNNVKLSLRTEVVKALREIDSALRQSSPGQTMIAGGTLVCRVPADTDGDGDAVDGNGNVEWGMVYQFTLGGMDGEQLLRMDGAGNSRVVANHIRSMQFTADNPAAPSEVTVRITAGQRTASGLDVIETLERTISLRNE